MTELPANARINFEKAAVLLLDDSTDGMSIVVQILTGFGVKKINRCSDLATAQDVATQWDLDLALVNANMRDEEGYEFINWLRRAQSCESNRFTSVMVLSGHTKVSNVKKARDCGANFTVAKPLSPSVLLERLVWVAREKRPFVVCDTYAGPERRFQDKGPPEGLPGRRASDRMQSIAAELPDISNDEQTEQKRDVR